VWLGNDDNSPTKEVTGGSLPAQIWRDVMEPAHRGLKWLPLPGDAPSTQVAVGTQATSVDQAETPKGLFEMLFGKSKPTQNQSNGLY
jgi:penicillin-binding protein 1A